VLLISAPVPPAPGYLKRRNLASRLAHLGFFQTVTLGFTDAQESRDGHGIGDRPELRTLKNPLGEDFSVMRGTLLRDLARIARLNLERGAREVRFFEIAPVFEARDGTVTSVSPIRHRQPVEAYLSRQGRYAHLRLQSRFAGRSMPDIKAIDLRKKLADAERALADLQARKEALSADQSRYRDNLDTVGRDSSQGQQYVKRLMDSETAIDQTSSKIIEAQKGAKDAQSAYESYLGNLSL